MQADDGAVEPAAQPGDLRAFGLRCECECVLAQALEVHYETLLETVERVRDSFNPMLSMEGIVLTMFDERTNLARQVVDDIRQHFGDKVFETVIPRNIRLGEAPSFGKPVLSYDIKSKGAEAYLSLAREFLKRREAK